MIHSVNSMTECEAEQFWTMLVKVLRWSIMREEMFERFVVREGDAYPLFGQ